MDTTEQKVRVVIELSEKDYIAIRDCHAKIGEDLFNLERNMAIAIRNGTPLPEGHGDLIDRSEVTKKGVYTYHWWHTGEDEKAYPAEWVDDAEVIIPADKESDNEN